MIATPEWIPSPALLLLLLLLPSCHPNVGQHPARSCGAKAQVPVRATVRLMRLRSIRGGADQPAREHPTPKDVEDGKLIDYTKQGVINYSKFERIAAEESSDIDEEERKRREDEKKRKRRMSIGKDESGKDESKDFLQLLIEKEKEKQAQQRVEEEANKKLCVAKPNKWNGVETELYSFRQYIQNMEVYINMTATGAPGPWRAKDMSVTMTDTRVDISYNRGGKSYTVLSGEFCNEIFPDDSYWVLETEPECILNLVLKKRSQGLWPQFLKGHVGINMQQIHGASDYFELQREINERYNLSTPEQRANFASLQENREE